MKAIVLSAGQGKRLLPLTESRPKCLIPVAGRTVLEWQLRALAENGIDDIVVVTGFGADAVDREVRRLGASHPGLRTLFNPFYSVADNVGSCFVARPEMIGDFVLMNGDTLFEPAVLASALAQARLPVNVTVDRKERYDSDDMKVCLDGDRLKRIGKHLPPEDVDAESIGLLVFRGDGGARFGNALETLLRQAGGLGRWYLFAVDMLAADRVVGVAPIEGLAWSEIDFPADLSRAEALAAGWSALDPLPAVRSV